MDPADVRVSTALRAALREWTEVADTVLRSGDAHAVDLLRRRGRQLASRVADVLGRPVEFVDPVSGTVESISAGTGPAGTGPEGNDGARTTAHDRAERPVAPTPTPRPPSIGAPHIGPRPAAPVHDSPEPTPWGTGAAVAAFFAVLIGVADVVLVHAFPAEVGLLWLPANALVTAGTVPALWLARRVPFWRWPAFGAAVGLGAAWVVLLLGLLG